MYVCLHACMCITSMCGGDSCHMSVFYSLQLDHRQFWGTVSVLGTEHLDSTRTPCTLMPLNYLWCSWLGIVNDFHTYIEEKLNSFIRKVWIWSAGLLFSYTYLWTGKNSAFMKSTLMSNSDYSADLINNFIFQSENFTFFLDFLLLAILTSVVCEWI